MRTDVHVCQMRTPADVSEIAKLFDAGTIDPADVVAVVGKSEGTGLGRDVGRETADLAIRTLLAQRTGCSPAEIADRVCIVLSGGSPGVITPHVALFTRTADPAPKPGNSSPRLVVGLSHSEEILPEEVGRMGQISKVRSAVSSAMKDAGLTDPSDVHLVLVKAPSLTTESIADANSRGHETVTRDVSIGPEGAICYSNDGSALGVALALGEATDDQVHDSMVRRDWSVYSDVAMTSSGGEKTHAEVLLLGNSTGSSSPLRIGHRSMRTIIDASAVGGALESAGIARGCDVGETSRTVVYALAKMIMPETAELDGRRITMLDDQVGYHVAKAMGGFLLASLTGHTAVFVSGGERNSHQGPPNGNPLAVIVRMGV
ncbi:ring-opening amidohydrolase [Arthrobacter sp. MI7-26]|uniref:ring-opening amidohydrolase n=1 Tax=Arthrobacter sp. MI7-26 TaxID=2993653 RepID=UPI0022492C29|nr:ring-opening amidohydrolase [Arthrobacter sp. MI7-26]MCX2748889.1 ring-opening amidohydrolase [Arthrobacter sp. MI7-26]